MPGASGGVGRWLVMAAVALAAVAVVLLLASGPGTRAGWWHFRIGLGLLRYGFYAAAAGIVLALAGGALGGGWRRALVAVVVGLVALAPPLLFARRGAAAPRIHDISTDLEDPPAFEAVLPARAGAANPPEHPGAEVAAQQRQAYPDLVPIRLPGEPPALAYALALSTARGLGWEIVAADAASGRIEATDTTFWFGFADDVVIRIRAEDGGSRIDVRSKSRVGKSDVGANAARIRRFRDALGAAGARIAPPGAG